RAAGKHIGGLSSPGLRGRAALIAGGGPLSKTKSWGLARGVVGGARPPLASLPAHRTGVTVDEKAHTQPARRLKIPVHFAVPASARVALPKSIDWPDRLLDFRHPDAKSASGDVGLRLVIAKRAGLARRLAQSGLIATGDLLLSVRPEWGGAGA